MNIKIHITIILPIILYGCEIWCLILWEEHKLGVFENRVLKKIFGPKKEESAGQWRKLHNEQLYGLYFSPNVIRVIKSKRMWWVGHVARIGDRRGAYRVLADAPGAKRPFCKPMHREDDNIKMDPQEIKCGGKDWSDLSQDRNRWWAFVNAVMNVQLAWNAGNFLTGWGPVSSSRRILLRGVIYLWNTLYRSTLRNDWYFRVTRAVSRRHPAVENHVQS